MTGRRRTANGRFTRNHPNEWDAEALAELRGPEDYEREEQEAEDERRQFLAVDPDKPATEPAQSPHQAELAEAYADYDATIQTARAAHRAAVDAAWNTLWQIEQQAADDYTARVSLIRDRYRYQPTPAIENVTPGDDA